MVKENVKDSAEVEPIKVKRTVNLNIRLYTNLLVEYYDINDVDAEAIREEIGFWNAVLDGAPQPDKKAVTKKANSNVPDDIEVLKECKKCGSTNLVYTTRTGKSGVWHAFDCQDCKSKSGDREYPTRNFVNKIEAKKKANPSKDEFDDNFGDDQDLPF